MQEDNRTLQMMPPDDETVARLVNALTVAGYTVVIWQDGPMPIIAPQTDTIQ
jgi:hypothetical protein